MELDWKSLLRRRSKGLHPPQRRIIMTERSIQLRKRLPARFSAEMKEEPEYDPSTVDIPYVSQARCPGPSGEASAACPCPLAEVLQGHGTDGAGLGYVRERCVRHLRSLGIDVAIGHSAENLKDCDLVIRTAAIRREPGISGPSHGASLYMSGRRPGAPSCRNTQMPCAFRYSRQDHHDLHGDPYLHGAGADPR